MLMKLERDRLSAKVDNLEMGLKQTLEEEQEHNLETKTESSPVKK